MWKATQCGVTRGGGLSQAHRVRWAVTRSHVPLPSAPCLCAVCGPHRILVCWQTVWKATQCGVTRGGGLRQARGVGWAATRSHVPLPHVCAPCAAQLTHHQHHWLVSHSLRLSPRGRALPMALPVGLVNPTNICYINALVTSVCSRCSLDSLSTLATQSSVSCLSHRLQGCASLPFVGL